MKFFKRIFSKWSNDNRVIFTDSSSINVQRIQYISWIMGIINIIHIVIFGMNTPIFPERVVLWYDLVIALHFLMAILNGILGIIAYYIEKRDRQSSKFSYAIQGLSIFINLLFGVLLCVANQLVTTDINPLLIAYIGVGVVFLIPPTAAIVFYSFALLLFFHMVTFFQPIPELLEHIRINSITATVMGISVSWINWKHHSIRGKQERQIIDQQKALEEKNEHLHFLATHDALTGIFNRSYFTEFVEAEIKRMARTNREACILLIDIDYFKKVNDNFGHPAGDKILKDIATMLTSGLRSSDIPARLGGEEFIILLPETSVEGGWRTAEKLRKKIQDYSFQYKEHSVKVTASMGVAKLTDSFQTTYSQADKALYTAKKNGRNHIEIA